MQGVMLDIKSAYDTVWREGFVHQLVGIGLTHILLHGYRVSWQTDIAAWRLEMLQLRYGLSVAYLKALLYVRYGQWSWELAPENIINEKYKVELVEIGT